MKESEEGFRQYLHIDYIISGACLTALVILTILGVVRRYVFNDPITWLEEIQMLLIVWIVFLGGSVAFRKKGHIAIEILVDSLPAAAKHPVYILITLTTGLILILMIAWGVFFIRNLAGIGRVTSVLQIPAQYVYAAFPLGAAFMLVSFVRAETAEFKAWMTDGRKKK